MKLKQLLIILLATVSLSVKAQSESINTDSLVFTLQILPVINQETKEVLTNVKAKLDDSGGYSQTIISDSLGEFPLIYLKVNTMYSIFIEKDKYLNAKGKESTVGRNKSMNFTHDYSIEQMGGCRPMLPKLYYEQNKITPFIIDEYSLGFKESDILNIFYAIMDDNPTLIVRLKGYRDISEMKSISKKRVNYFVDELIKLGVNKGRFQIIDGGVLKYVQRVGDDEKLTEKELKQENRTITFKVVSTDYQHKIDTE